MADEPVGSGENVAGESAAAKVGDPLVTQGDETNVIKEDASEAQDKMDKAEEANAPEPAPLLPLEPEAPESSLGNLDFILDVPLQITVNLGNRKMLIKELLQLGQGSVVELEKMAGEPMDVLIGERLIARGEVVVVNEKFGVRLTDIVSTVERINQLNR